MSDNPETESPVIPFQHDPETGEVFDEEGEKYAFKFHPQKRIGGRRGKFIDSEGREYEFRPMSQNVLLPFHQRFEDAHKPKVPKKAYEIGEDVSGKKEFSYEYDPDDIIYLAEVDKYTIRLGIVLASLQVSLGLKFDMPSIGDWPEELQALHEIAIDPKSRYYVHETKYLYIMGILDTEEGTFLLRLLQGMNMPTVEGIAQAEQRFPSNGESSASPES